MTDSIWLILYKWFCGIDSTWLIRTDSLWLIPWIWLSVFEQIQMNSLNGTETMRLIQVDSLWLIL